MNKVSAPKEWNELVALLDDLNDLHGRLASVVQEKIDAMRRADVAAMRAAHDRERELVVMLQEREAIRRALLERLGARLNLKARVARAMNVTQIASTLSGGARAAMIAAAHRLRESVCKLARLNRLAGAVSREVALHLQWVFASVRLKDAAAPAYSARGSVATASQPQLFEAVG